jgi:hypothetical protein
VTATPAIEVDTALTPTEVMVLRAAARRPGKRLRKMTGREYSTLREAAASLRSRGWLYPAKPAVILVRADWRKRLEFTGEPGSMTRRLLVHVSDTPGQSQDTIVGWLVYGELRTHAATDLLKLLRTQRLLHPWDGLVLTPEGVAQATALGLKVSQQLGTIPE